MKQTGIVISKNENIATIKTQRHSACGSCGGCAKGKEGPASVTVEAINKVNANIGDFVEVDMETTNVLKAAAIAYVIPLFCLLIGVLAGNKILKVINYNGNVDTGSALLGFTLMIISFLIIKMNEPNFKKSEQYTPIITNVIDK